MLDRLYRSSRRIFPFIRRVVADSGYAGEKVAKTTLIGRDRAQEPRSGWLRF